MRNPPKDYYYHIACKYQKMDEEYDNYFKSDEHYTNPYIPSIIVPYLLGDEFDGMLLSNKSMIEIAKWLGVKGINYFRKIKEEHGRIDAVWMEGGIPHPVHFREGMQVRNFLRGLDECKDWGCHKLDDKWVEIINAIIS